MFIPVEGKLESGRKTHFKLFLIDLGDNKMMTEKGAKSLLKKEWKKVGTYLLNGNNNLKKEKEKLSGCW